MIHWLHWIKSSRINKLIRDLPLRTMNVDLIAFHTFHSQSRIVNLVLLAEELFMSHDDSFSEERKCEFLGRSIKYFDQTWSA